MTVNNKQTKKVISNLVEIIFRFIGKKIRLYIIDISIMINHSWVPTY